MLMHFLSDLTRRGIVLGKRSRLLIEQNKSYVMQSGLQQLPQENTSVLTKIVEAATKKLVTELFSKFGKRQLLTTLAKLP